MVIRATFGSPGPSAMRCRVMAAYNSCEHRKPPAAKSRPLARARLARSLSASRMAACLSRGMVAEGRRRRHHARRVWHSGVPCIRIARRVAAAIRHLLLSARRALLRVVRIVAPACDRSDIRHLAAGRCHDRRHGRRRPRTLGGDSGLDGTRRGRHVRDRVAAAI